MGNFPTDKKIVELIWPFVLILIGSIKPNLIEDSQKLNNNIKLQKISSH